MNIALCQFHIENLAPERNRERVRELVSNMIFKNPTVAILPELFSVGILPETFQRDTADAIAKGDHAFLSELARTLSISILGSTLNLESGKLYNTSVLYDANGTLKSTYRKIHPFSLGGETEFIAGGKEVVCETFQDFVLQQTICYDLRFPELFRAGLRRGANWITVQANWPDTRQAHWETLLRARAIENQSYVAAVNCVGTQLGLRYVGGSTLLSPKGEPIVEMGDAEGVGVGEISATTVAAWRKVFPIGVDRKPEEFWK